MKETHLRIQTSDIREVKQSLAVYNIKAKVVRKNNETHLFVEDPNMSLNEFCASFTDASCNICSGCDFCDRSKTRAKSPLTRRVALYPPLLLLPTGSHVDSKEAQNLLNQYPKYTHVAVNAPIQVGDPVRRPKLIPLVGDFGTFTSSPQPSAQELEEAFWCTCVQNGIYQTWAPMYTMFSRGNITEKKRVLNEFKMQSPIAGSTVADLYAGIGYFTLSYAKNQPKVIYCWELNWWSVEGLLRAAKQNNIKARAIKGREKYVPLPDDCIVIFVEDNRHALDRLPSLDLKNLSHINMGLLPHCRDSFQVALGLAVCSNSTPIFHIHENVRVTDLEKWRDTLSQSFGSCLHIEKIKSYSPGVIHVCGDFTNTLISTQQEFSESILHT